MTNENDRANKIDQNPYASPKEAGSIPPGAGRTIVHNHRRAMLYAGIHQTFLLVIASLALDGGDWMILSIISVILAWFLIAVIVFARIGRSQLRATKLDIAAIQYGVWGFFLGMCFLYYCNLLPSDFYFGNRMMKNHSIMKIEVAP